jgi:hypothetical protein
LGQPRTKICNAARAVGRRNLDLVFAQNLNRLMKNPVSEATDHL